MRPWPPKLKSPKHSDPIYNLYNLSVEKSNLQERYENLLVELEQLRGIVSNSPQTGIVALQAEVSKLKKSLESKTRDFDYLSARYQDASAAAVSATSEVKTLNEEVEGLKRRLETDVKAITWESEKKGLLEKIKALEGRCKLLEEQERRFMRKQNDEVKRTSTSPVD
jgi:chromosome segregation ATPase